MASKDIDEYITSPIIEIKIGRGRGHKTYHMHKALLCEVSEFLHRCLDNDGFEEGLSGKVSLPEEHPDAFSWFVRWAYSGDLAPTGIRDVMLRISTMVKIYILGDKLVCEGLQNRAMDIIQAACLACTVETYHIIQAWDSGLQESLLFEYLLRQLVYEVNSGNGFYCDFPFGGEGHWKEFFETDPLLTQRLMCAMSEFGRIENPAEEEGCTWHVHTRERSEECERWPDRVVEGND